MVTVYCDGRLLFERFSARARPRAAMCASGCGRLEGNEAGRIRCGIRRVRLFRAQQAPRVLTGAVREAFVFDGRPHCWALVSSAKQTGRTVMVR